MNIVRDHAPGAGLIAQPVDHQSSALPLSNGSPSDDDGMRHMCMSYEM